MAGESNQEKTEKATPRRRLKARDEGRVAKSMELNSALIILLGGMSLYLMGTHLSGNLKELMQYTMTNAPLIAVSDPTFAKMFGDNMLRFFITLGPVFAVMVVMRSLLCCSTLIAGMFGRVERRSFLTGLKRA